MAYADLGNKQLRTLQLLAAGRAGGDERIANRAEGKLERQGIDPADFEALLEEAGPGAVEAGLTTIARRGPIGGRRAERMAGVQGEAFADEAAEKARLLTSESIERGASSLGDRLTALGADFDPSSPAYGALIQRYLAGRDVDMTNAMNQIDLNLANAKYAIRAGGLNPQILADIGDTEFMLEELDKQADDIDNAMQGQLLGSVTGALAGLTPLGPLGAMLGGAGGGFLGGGTRGGAAGASAGLDIGALLALMKGMK